MPMGPVIISPDGLFPSLYRELVLRRPHEFKIRALDDIRALFPGHEAAAPIAGPSPGGRLCSCSSNVHVGLSFACFNECCISRTI